MFFAKDRGFEWLPINLLVCGHWRLWMFSLLTITLCIKFSRLSAPKNEILKILFCHCSKNMQHQTVSATAASWCAGICSCSHCDSSPFWLTMSNTAESCTLISTVNFLSKMRHTYLLLFRKYCKEWHRAEKHILTCSNLFCSWRTL